MSYHNCKVYLRASRLPSLKTFAHHFIIIRVNWFDVYIYSIVCVYEEQFKDLNCYYSAYL